VSARGTFAGTIVGISRTLADAMVYEDLAHRPGLLQSLDPRARLVGLLSLVLAVTLAHRLSAILLLLAAGALLARLSHVGILLLGKRVWLPVLVFSAIVALPAVFLTPGSPAFSIDALAFEATHQGLNSAALLISRVEAAATLTTLLVVTTPWMHILNALRSFRVPQEIVLILAMTHRYVFLLAETATQMFQSRQSRTVGSLDRATQRHVTTRTAGVLLSKSMELSGEVFLAMQARGFRGNARALVGCRLRAKDFLGMAAFLAFATLCVWAGRS